MPNKVFGERVRKLRSDRGLTMDALAKNLGLAKSRISMWENNGVVPREDILKRLSVFFGVSTDFLLGNDTMEGREPEGSPELQVIQRGLKGMDEEQLKKAKAVLSSVFDEIFEDDEG